MRATLPFTPCLLLSVRGNSAVPIVPRRLAESGGILLCAAVLLVTGCREEVAYDPAEEEAKPQPAATATTEPEPTEPDDPPEPAGERSTEEVAKEQPAATVVEDPQQEPPPEFDEDDLFGIAQPETTTEPEPARQEEEPQPAPPDREESLLPWENENDRYRRADQERGAQGAVAATPPEAETEVPPTDSGTQTSLLPWENEQAAAGNADSTLPPVDEPQMAAPQETRIEPVPPLPEATPPAATPEQFQSPEVEWLPSAESPPPPASAPTTSRHAAWLLGSKLSYTLLAPAAEADRVRGELEPLASLLGVDLPEINFIVDHNNPESLAQVLRVGREVGEQLSDRHDTAHAALVEMAFKSNVLLAAYEKMPHLAHSIAGSVAAASVRAEVPESIWQPWQDQVVAGESTERVEGAILEFHREIDNFLRNPPSESPPPILR